MCSIRLRAITQFQVILGERAGPGDMEAPTLAVPGSFLWVPGTSRQIGQEIRRQGEAQFSECVLQVSAVLVLLYPKKIYGHILLVNSDGL
jgi:hypothetical protein